ncbi:LacI family DNA-binding transcriptional regulator [Marisediminicola senii]|uniref:LacI family DNA-binding transcriptional regulator n=1 Tax=Marisediminicola senii TaxID=2711233 RepID=UPI0022A6BC7E|nr:LacI family DNA-binding transcriptional regulator [Marisediminicola senii]
MAVTRADVARRAGVSPAVVSYVLNPGSRPVSAAARARIEAAIAELGYRPNAVAQALRRSATMSIGLMVSDLANPAIAAGARAIEDIAYDRGYVLFIGTVGHDTAREERYLQSYVDRQVDGLILVGAHATEMLEKLAKQGLRIIVLGAIEHGLGISSIMAEGRAATEDAVRHLIEVHGHTRIGCITGPSNQLGAVEERVNGWRSALADAGLANDDSLLYRAPAFSRTTGHDGAAHLLDTAKPTAMFVASDVQAVGTIGAIRRRGLQVPEDIALISYDGSELSTHAYPRFTTIDPDIGALAELAMKRLIALLDKSQTEETHDVLPAQLAIRRSCGCVE